jgi:predicted MFS family arabinose efflux permease
MTCYFIGGTLGSIGSAVCYGSYGWDGVAALGTSVASLALVLSFTDGRFRRRQAARAASAGPAQQPV